MPSPRKAQVSLDATPYYHCVSRCVRRAFLCGKDARSGQSYEHRKQWIEERLLKLAGIFAIDICAYAVMSNHYHVVLCVDQAGAKNWTPEVVVRRWHQVFKGNLLSQRYARGEVLTSADRQMLDECIQCWRQRLMDISWYMRCLNEAIARQANQEDGCTGRFWEGRFKSQALLDEKALLACMAYVDLNPVRAKVASTPEASANTSIKRRVKKAKQARQLNHPRQQPKELLPFGGNPGAERAQGLPFRLSDYLELVDWTGRIVRDDKRGVIEGHIPPLLVRLALDPEQWVYNTRHFESRFKTLVGSALHLRRACQMMGKCWAHGITRSQQAFVG